MLGSCVSITLWHPRLHVGAMSHFLLATRAGDVTAELDGRYAAEATSLMLLALARYGVVPRECQAKLFGGGNMFPHHTRQGVESSVGYKNGLAARLLMQERGIPIASESLFGNGHRRIVFEVDTGDVWSRQVEPVSVP